MKHFDSYKSYFGFALAREYAYIDSCRPFSYNKSRMEKIGEFIASPLLKPGDYVLKNMRNPLFITAAVIIGLALTTLVFYPALIPGLLAFSAGLKGLVFLLTQSSIVGLCMRTLGRLNNTQLMTAWKNREIQIVRVGSMIVQL